MKFIHTVVGIALAGFVTLVIFLLSPSRPIGGRGNLIVTEEVEAVMYRTRLFHPGCVSNGCWCLNGQPRKITAYGIDKCVWPHRCDGCGQTNEIYDAQWPKFRREWRAVK